MDRPGKVKRPAWFVANRGDQHRRLGVQVVQQVLQHGQRLRVGVLQVFEHHQAAAATTDSPGQTQHRLGEHDQRGGLRPTLIPVRDKPA